jgi:hypothetical protein
MNYIEAIKLVNEGKKIRRPNFENYHYVILDSTDRLIIWDHIDNKYKKYYPTIESILADDWEIYGEKGE